MTKTPKTKPQKILKKPHKKIDKKLKKKPTSTPIESSPSADSVSDSDDLPKLLEPFSKDQLIDLICDAAHNDSTFLARIRDLAERDITHRKIFVHGLGWDTTRDSLLSALKSFGEIEDCNVVIDKNTGKAKGFAFVLFKTREGASNALRSPRVKIKNRIATCQLASVGPSAPDSKSKVQIQNQNSVQNSVQAVQLQAHAPLLGQYPPLTFNTNPVYRGLLANPSGAGFFGPAAGLSLSQGGQLGGGGGLIGSGGTHSLLGPFGSGAVPRQVYPVLRQGGAGGGGSLSGYSSSYL